MKKIFITCALMVSLVFSGSNAQAQTRTLDPLEEIELTDDSPEIIIDINNAISEINSSTTQDRRGPNWGQVFVDYYAMLRSKGFSHRIALQRAKILAKMDVEEYYGVDLP